MSNSDTKKCPVCGKDFTREQVKLNANQWFLRVYCSGKCMRKGRFGEKGGKFGKG